MDKKLILVIIIVVLIVIAVIGICAFIGKTDNENAENNQSMQTEGIVQEDENDGKPHSITTSQGGSVEYEVPSHTNEENLELANPNINVDTSIDVVGPVY